MNWFDKLSGEEDKRMATLDINDVEGIKKLITPATHRTQIELMIDLAYSLGIGQGMTQAEKSIKKGQMK